MKFKHLQLKRTTRLILQDVGLLLHVPGIMALLSIFISLGFGEFYAIKPFLGTAIASLIPAQLLYRLFSPRISKTRLYPAMLTAAWAWALISLIGAIPFLEIAHFLSTTSNPPQTVLGFQNGWNAIFESFSGFTGTGLSMAKNASELPRSLQWWRSFSEWVDGVGIIILVLAITDPNVDESQLYHSTGRQQTIKNSITATARNILWIYGFYTVLSILLLTLLGMRSRLHRFLSIPHNSLQYQVNNQPLNERQALRNFQSASVLTILWLMLLAIGIFVLSHLVSSDYTLADVVFEATSATSNVGLSTGISDPNLHWGGKLTLILLMWIGRLEIIPILLLVRSLIPISNNQRQ